MMFGRRGGFRQPQTGTPKAAGAGARTLLGLASSAWAAQPLDGIKRQNGDCLLQSVAAHDTRIPVFFLMFPPCRLLASMALCAFLPAIALCQTASNLLWPIRSPQDLTGWTIYNVQPGAQLSVRDGGVSLPCGNDTYMIYPAGLNAADYPTVVLDIDVLRTEAPVETLAFYWGRIDAPIGPDTAKGVPISADHRGLLYIDLRGHPEWHGRINQLRLDPLQGPGEVVLRGIGLMTTPPPAGTTPGVRTGPVLLQTPIGAEAPGSYAGLQRARLLATPPATPPVREWDFVANPTPQGWKFYDETYKARGNEKPIQFTRDGAVLVSTEVDPQFRLVGTNIDASQAKVLVIELGIQKLGAANPEPNISIFWSATSEDHYVTSEAVHAPVRVSQGMQRIVIGLAAHPRWTGYVQCIRIDPCDNAAVTTTIRRIAFH